MKGIIEVLADYEHNRWSKWQKYVHNNSIKNPDGSITIPKEKVQRWEKQMNTEYSKLTENEKESDRKEAIQILNIINNGDYNE